MMTNPKPYLADYLNAIAVWFRHTHRTATGTPSRVDWGATSEQAQKEGGSMQTLNKKLMQCTYRLH